MKLSRIVIIAAVLTIGIYAFYKLVAFPIILETHTAFLFIQIEEVLQEEEDAPVTVEALMDLIRASELDWNSCELKESEIRDAWGRAIRMELQEGEWVLQSSGENGLFGDSDDIIQMIKMTA